MSISDGLKNDLALGMDIERVFQKHVVDGPSHLFSTFIKNVDDEYDLRHEIARATNTSINDVILVGSAKLGFSVKTEKFSSFDERYILSGLVKEKSDVDIAIVNEALFDLTAEEIYHLSHHFNRDWISKNWVTNCYYPNVSPLFKKYSQYHVKGWLRPDFMPNSYISEARWSNACDAWRKKLQRKVSIGIYRNWTYLKHYHMDHLEILQSKITSLEGIA
jgi:hypothetical protein